MKTSTTVHKLSGWHAGAHWMSVGHGHSKIRAVVFKDAKLEYGEEIK